MALDCPRDCAPPCLGDSPCPDIPGISYSVYVYSNDGNTLLWSAQFYNSMPFNPARILYGLYEDTPYVYHFSGGYFTGGFDMSEYSGLSYSPNQTVGEIPLETTLGESYLYGLQEIYINPEHDVTVYVVGGSPAPTGNTLDVTYGGTKIIDSLEVTPPVTVTYNGSTIATLNTGDTKILQCNGKLMASDVVIGGKTLQCANKLMASDVVIEVGGGNANAN